ncbi:MAG: ATP-binding protein [Terriglobia bacterium]
MQQRGTSTRGLSMPGHSFNLSLRLTICLVLVLVVIFVLLGRQIIYLHQRHLEESVFANADRISDTIKRSTRYSMLQNHRDEVYHIISTIGGEPGIGKIRIYNDNGRISYSTDAQEIGSFVDKQAEACTACHSQGEPLHRLQRPDRMRIYTTANGSRNLGLINPIENEASCTDADCHAHSPQRQVLGVLDVTLSLAKVDEAIAAGTRKLVANFLLVLLAIPLLIGVPVWLMVYRPVRQLTLGTERVASGDLDALIPISSRDEIGQLAASFNQMVVELRRAKNELDSWNQTLESRIKQKTKELQDAQQQIVNAERMASVGKLAAIVAHEINNPLSGILTYAKLLLKQLKNSQATGLNPVTTTQYLEVIASESARCGEIVKNLLQFARQGKVNLQPNSLNDLVQQSLRLVQHKIDLMNLRTSLRLDPTLPSVTCDAPLIRQALVALLINACEAMSTGEGILEIGTRQAADRSTVELSVCDNGIGMDQETQKHIFEPFFTTKEQGKGVGLGLAVVYGIVQQHGGVIAVESSPGKGTTFRLHLPLKKQEDLEADRPEKTETWPQGVQV